VLIVTPAGAAAKRRAGLGVVDRGQPAQPLERREAPLLLASRQSGEVGYLERAQRL
jgi:hypothetical protein